MQGGSGLPRSYCMRVCVCVCVWCVCMQARVYPYALSPFSFSVPSIPPPSLPIPTTSSPQPTATQASWRRVVGKAVEMGVPTPAFSTALAFYDGYRSERLPANLIQAQRDYFGAHTYERLDNPGKFVHTNWTGRGGNVSSSTYNA